MKNHTSLVLLSCVLLLMIWGLTPNQANPFLSTSSKKSSSPVQTTYSKNLVRYAANLPDATNVRITEGFHDQSALFMSPTQPTTTDNVTLRVRVAARTVVSGKLMYSINTVDTCTWQEVSLQLDGTDESGYYEFWKGTIPAQQETFRYRFKLINNTGTYYVMPQGTSTKASQSNQNDFIILPGFSTPSWSQGTTYFSLMPDSFYNGDPSNDTRFGYQTSSLAFGMDHRSLNDWFGGDLVGIEKKMKYITDYIGANAISFNPIWQAYNVAGYGADDLNMINAHFGSEENLMQLIKTAHSSNAKVILDGVFELNSSNSTYFNANGYYPLPGAATSATNRFSSFFGFTNWPNYISSWGCPVINLDSVLAQKYVYTTPTSIVQRYLSAPFGADGWRFDVGNTVYGTTRTEHQILKDIRTYIKQANPEAVFISEHASTNDLYDYTLDSKWNYAFGWPVMSWANNGMTQTDLAATLFDAVNRLPRSVALSSYNFLTTHDETSIGYKLNYDTKKIKSAQILQMTYLGSPSIYYLDATGAKPVANLDVDGNSPEGTNFDSMDWNQNDWNFEVTDLYRSLCELRNTHSALRTGTFEKLDTDDSNMVFSYARYDANSKVIVMTCQNPNDISYTVNARQIGAKNGEIFTNWLTGEQYTVDENGKLTVPIYAKDGGLILVNGGQVSSSFRRTGEIVSVGSASKNVNSSIRYASDTNSIAFENSGSITSKTDNFAMMSTKTTNNFQYVTQIEKLPANSSAAMIVRDSLGKTAAEYFVKLDGNGVISVYARKGANQNASLLCSYRFGENMWIMISRTNGNTFKVYVSYDKNGAPEMWQFLSKSTANIQLDATVYTGITGLSGKTQFSEPACLKTPAEYGDSFDGVTLGSLFSTINHPTYSISGGQLLLTSDNKASMVTAAASYNDFSVKTKIDNAPTADGQSTMLTVCVDQNEYLKVGRRYQNGKSVLVFSRVQYGTEQLYGAVSDPDISKSVYVQLQRIGTEMTAFWSTDGVVWTQLSNPIHYNASELYAGVMATSTLQSFVAKFSYFTFGDYVNDNATNFNTPVTGSVISLSTSDSLTKVLGNFVIHSGSWDYTNGGFIQSKNTGAGVMGLENRTISNLYLETSLKITGSGWAGVGFYLKDTTMGVAKGGYLVRLSQSGKLDLIRNTKTIASTTISKDLSVNGVTRVVVNAVDGYITVKCGTNDHVVLEVKDSTYTSGLCGFYTYKAAAEFRNYKFMDDSTNWSCYSGTSIENSKILTSGIMSWATLNNYAFTNFVVSAKINVYGPVSKSNESAASGFQIAKMATYTPLSGGILVGFNDYGQLYIKENNVVVAKATVSNKEENVVTLAVVDGVYTVFLNGSNKPVLTYKSPNKNGGALQLFSINSGGFFDNIEVNPLNIGQNYTSTDIFKSLK